MNNPYYSIEAEIGVLGALLVEKKIVSEIIPQLDKSYFSLESHKIIFEGISYLYDNNKPVEPIILINHLKEKKLLDKAGGEEYILELVDKVFSAANAPYYADILKEKGVRRLLVEAVEKIKEYSRDSRYVLEDLLDRAEKIIFDITQKKISQDPVHIREALKEFFLEIEKRKERKILATGFPDLDKMISGLQKASLIIIAGRPSMGKTSFALNIATNVAFTQGQGVLIFSLEMPKVHIARNILCSIAGISPHVIYRGDLREEDLKRLAQIEGYLKDAPIFIDDTPNLSLREIKAKARRYKSKYNIKLVIIDYIQLMEFSKTLKTENRQQEISRISRGLKSMARELDVPVIALSQLNRSVDARDDHRPRMSDLRESGALEQDADIIMFLYRDEYYNKDTKKVGVAEIIIAKHRNGPTGNIELFFHKNIMKFTSLVQNEE